MKSEDLLKKILRNNNYSVTKTRRIVFELLEGKPPQTMRELIEAARSTVDRVSVYRIIELYETLGIVHRVTIGWKYKLELSDIFLAHHHHICCLTCGKIVTIKDEESLENSIRALSEASGFTLKHHQLEMQGYCDTCTKTRQTRTG
jgi:Fur family ferric uptake transcriptional regulator